VEWGVGVRVEGDEGGRILLVGRGGVEEGRELGGGWLKRWELVRGVGGGGRLR
jgi:hypothetical protein